MTGATFHLGHWPLVVGVLFLVAAAVSQWRKARVPNLLVISFALTALVTGVAIQMGIVKGNGVLYLW